MLTCPLAPQPYPPTPGGASSAGPSGGDRGAEPSSASSAPVVDLSVDPATVPAELKNEGQDWFAVFNPAPGEPGAVGKKRTLDVQLVHTLMHERYVFVFFRLSVGREGRWRRGNVRRR